MKSQLFISLLVLSGCSQLTKQPQTIYSDSPKPVAAMATTPLAAEPASAAVKNYVSALPSRGLNPTQVLHILTFGSCANQDQAQLIWKTIEQQNSDLFLFMGDNVYASNTLQTPRAEQYRKLDQIKEYQSIREKVPFLATWDDHDYGEKDGGASYADKVAAKKDFLNYWSYARAAMPLDRDGIYHSKILGPKDQAVQIILLDTRYNRDELLTRPGLEGKSYNFLPNELGTVLGKSQWDWLEKQLSIPAKIRIIVSSIQVLPNDPPFEKWGNFPKERQKLLDLIVNSKAKNVVLLSGDRHMGSISKMPLKGYGDLIEITASSLNRPTGFGDADQFYQGEVYNRENFGVARIDWVEKKMKVELKGMHDQVVNSIEIPLID